MTSDLAHGNEPAADEAAACPKSSQLEDFTHGRLNDSQAASLQAHLRFCIDCSSRCAALSETAPDANKPASVATKPERFDYPEMVAEFRLLRLLGQGAMGQVFAAHDTFLDRTVALKFLPTLEARAAARERFYIEARAVARLQHPNVVTLYRAGEENGRPYLVSELVRGRSLDHTKKPVDSDAVLNIALGIARGLAAAHRHGVLHRDIKPAKETTERNRTSNDPQRYQVLANQGLGCGSIFGFRRSRLAVQRPVRINTARWRLSARRPGSFFVAAALTSLLISSESSR